MRDSIQTHQFYSPIMIKPVERSYQGISPQKNSTDKKDDQHKGKINIDITQSPQPKVMPQ